MDDASAKVRALGAVLVAVVIAAYLPSLRGTWVYDDLPGIVENPTIRHAASAFFPPSHSGLPVSGRPLLNASFALNYAFGGTDPRGYHLVNLLIHAGATLLLFGIARRTSARCRPGGPPRSAEFVGFAISALWAVHPLQTEAVTYVVQRAESLAGFFFLLTLYAHIRAIDTHARLPWTAVSVAACAAGMATKEVVVAAPVVVLLYDWTFVGKGLGPLWRRFRGEYAALATTWTGLLWLVWNNGARGGTAGFAVKASWWSYLAAQCHAHLLYLKLAIWPHPLVFDYGVDRLPIALPLPVLDLVLAALIVGTVVGIHRRSTFGFLAGGYFLILAPTSTVLPIVTETVAEHRMYLPLAGLISVVVLAVTKALGRFGLVSLFVAALPLLVCTVHRHPAYASERALWSDTVAKWPDNARAQYNLGRVLDENGAAAVAVPHYEAALRLRPDFASAHSNLANALLQLGRAADGERHAEEAISLNPLLPEAHNNLGNALLLRGDILGAIDAYEQATQLAPRNPDFHNNLGTALTRIGRLDDALREYDKAIQLRPDSPLIHFNQANTYARLARYQDAIAEYQTVLRLNPGYPGALDHLQRVRQLEARAARP